MSKPVITAKPIVMRYRFYCPACTGRAFYAPVKHAFNNVTCQHCGALVSYDPNGWFELSPEEFAKVNNIL